MNTESWLSLDVDVCIDPLKADAPEAKIDELAGILHEFLTTSADARALFKLMGATAVVVGGATVSVGGIKGEVGT